MDRLRVFSTVLKDKISGDSVPGIVVSGYRVAEMLDLPSCPLLHKV